MKVKVESVLKGHYGYDSIVVNLDNKRTEIVFNSKLGVAKYNGKYVDLICNNGTYTIKEIKTEK